MLFSYKEMHCDLKGTNRNFFTGDTGYQRLTATLYLQFPDLHALFVLPFLLQFYLSNDIILMVLLSKYIQQLYKCTHTCMRAHTQAHITTTNFYWPPFPKVRSLSENKALITKILRFLYSWFLSQETKAEESSEKMNWHSKQSSWEFILINQNIQLSIYMLIISSTIPYRNS